jgi:hypothetical protein
VPFLRRRMRPPRTDGHGPLPGLRGSVPAVRAGVPGAPRSTGMTGGAPAGARRANGGRRSGSPAGRCSTRPSPTRRSASTSVPTPTGTHGSCSSARLCAVRAEDPDQVADVWRAALAADRPFLVEARWPGARGSPPVGVDVVRRRDRAGSCVAPPAASAGRRRRGGSRGGVRCGADRGHRRMRRVGRGSCPRRRRDRGA